jgi:single-strand DNA-binding protein
MNIVVLKGNLTKDPVARTVKLPSGKEVVVCNFSIAVNRKYEKEDGTKESEVTFVDCEAWDSGASAIQRYLKKGSGILINGSLKLDQWESEGQKRSKLKVRVGQFEFLTFKKPEDGQPSQESTPVSNEVPETVGVASADPGVGGADIPF